jgi:asparagine synthase (glutamine-hydrolysing)
VSGFAGMVSLDGAPPDARLLERMAQTLAFRGPDGTHITTKPSAGFCFTFLRTGPAPQCPSQPCSLDDRTWLLGDVRLDGRDDLRRKLEQHGYEISDAVTDEELVLRAWHRWREDALPGLIGDYSFALWDAEARQLCCARDLMGARPFFYAQAGNRLYFSNTLNAIRCAPEISAELDDDFIGDFLLDGWNSDGVRTAFRDVSRLPAAHSLLYSSQVVRVSRYTSVPIEEPLQLKREEEYVEQFREVLEQAVAERLPRGPAAILMSGGLDSTSVAAIAQHTARRRSLPLELRAYTLDYQPLFDDQEGRLASAAARFIGIPIQIQSGSFHLPFAGWDVELPPMPEPFHDPFRRLYVGQNQQVAEHTRAVVNGYGGDGVLTGQSWPYLLYLIRGRHLWDLARRFGGYLLGHGRIPPLRGGFRSGLKRWLKPPDLMARYPKWLSPAFEKTMNLRQRWREMQRPFESSHPWHPRAHSILNGLFFSSILESEDPAWTGVPLVPRAPLLDLRVQRFLLRVPPVPLCVNKELLRRAVRGLLPNEILSRAKTPFEGDQVALQVRKHLWNPLPLQAPTRAIQEFVAWEKLGTVMSTESISFPWANLRPISLLYWLRAIERVDWIQ